METIILRGWQLVADKDGNNFWRDRLNPTHTFPMELALLAEVKREADVLKSLTMWRCPTCFEMLREAKCRRCEEMN